MHGTMLSAHRRPTINPTTDLSLVLATTRNAKGDKHSNLLTASDTVWDPKAKVNVSIMAAGSLP
jgi:hypothetical protein